LIFLWYIDLYIRWSRWQASRLALNVSQQAALWFWVTVPEQKRKTYPLFISYSLCRAYRLNRSNSPGHSSIVTIDARILRTRELLWHYSGIENYSRLWWWFRHHLPLEPIGCKGKSKEVTSCSTTIGFRSNKQSCNQFPVLKLRIAIEYQAKTSPKWFRKLWQSANEAQLTWSLTQRTG
jgi:hypothetical protein